ncbi:MAG: hypothetical protein ACRCU3_11225, partial [Eubacteriaceae bacterium]
MKTFKMGFAIRNIILLGVIFCFGIIFSPQTVLGAGTSTGTLTIDNTSAKERVVAYEIKGSEPENTNFISQVLVTGKRTLILPVGTYTLRALRQMDYELGSGTTTNNKTRDISIDANTPETEIFTYNATASKVGASGEVVNALNALDVVLVYYEKYHDSTYGFYYYDGKDYVNTLINTNTEGAPDDRHIDEAGYGVIAKPEVTGAKTINWSSANLGIEIAESVSEPTSALAATQLREGNKQFDQHKLYPFDIKYNYTQYSTTSAMLTPTSVTFDGREIQGVKCLPYFAKGIYKNGEGEVSIASHRIRTPQQMINLSFPSGGEDQSKGISTVNQTFVQELELDFGILSIGVGGQANPFNTSIVRGSFKGTFNGKGSNKDTQNPPQNKVTWLKIDTSKASSLIINTGLFEKVVAGTINDVHIDKSAFTGTRNVGSLAGEAEEASFNNCEINESGAAGIVTGEESVGGLVGFGINTDFEACVNGEEVKGLVGINPEALTPIYTGFGGILGTGRNIQMRNSENTGNISGENHVGGMIGHLEDDTIASNIVACNNGGTITANSKNTEGSVDAYFGCAGGILGIGIVGDGQSQYEIKSCTNTKT